MSSTSSSVNAPSVTSTTVWEHESFVDFQPKVLAFAKTLIWPQSDLNDEITVERLRGGGYNRIIGLRLERAQIQAGDEKLKDGQCTETKSFLADVQYILRIPRAEWTQVDDDVAALLFVDRFANRASISGTPKIPVPKVITFDWTTNNCLESHFMVQHRLRGRPLLDVYPDLSHEQQRQVARELGQFFRRMISVSSTVPGKLVLPENNKSLDAEIHVTAWEDPELGRFLPKGQRKTRTSVPYRSGPATESVVDVLTRIFRDQKEKAVPKDGWAALRFERFSTMASEMDDDGYFKEFDGRFTLSHLDLEPRNILADPESALGCPIITGILDWDSAILAPAFMSCSPPIWIWHWTGDEEADERVASEEPPTHDQRELKAEFETSAGTEYMQCAYHPAYRLARRLVRLAIYDEHDKEDIEQSDELLEEWEQLFRNNAAAKAETQGGEPASKPTGCEVVVRNVKETDVHNPNVEVGGIEISHAEDQSVPVLDGVSPPAACEDLYTFGNTET